MRIRKARTLARGRRDRLSRLTARHRVRPGTTAKVRADGAEVPSSHALDRPRDPRRGRAGAQLRRPRDGRAARGGRQGPAPCAVDVAAAVVGREPALLQLVRPARPEGPQRLPRLRPPDGRPPPLRSRAPLRRLRATTLLTIAGLALSVAGCGSDSGAVPEVPGPPAALSVPHQKGVAASGTATPTPTASASATATPSATGSTGSTGTTAATGSTGATAGTGTGGTSTTTGAAATPAPATQNTSSTDQAPATDSPPQKFEQFCQENAGAC